MKSVYAVAKSILNGIASEEDIEECVQDVFIDAWNNIDRYDNKRGSLKTWLLILCKYKALNIRNNLVKNGRFINVDDLKLEDSTKVEEDYELFESKKEMLDAVKALNSIDREIFLRRYFLEQGIGEISNNMNLTRQAVDNRLWRGKKRLKVIFSSMKGCEISE